MSLFKNYDNEFAEMYDKLDVIYKSAVSNEKHLLRARDDIANRKKDNSVLIKLADLSGEIVVLREEIESMKSDISEIKKMLHDEFYKPIENVAEPDIISEVYFGHLKVPKSYYEAYLYNQMRKDWLFISGEGKHRPSVFSVFDIQLLSMIENEDTWNNWKGLNDKIGMSMGSLQRLLYNIKIGTFDEWLDYAPNFSKSYGLLYVDGKKTNVPIKTANYIVECVTNSPNPMTTLLKLEKAGECDKLLYRMIGVNYANSQLRSLFNERQIKIENNPQKRKEKAL